MILIRRVVSSAACFAASGALIGAFSSIGSSSVAQAAPQNPTRAVSSLSFNVSTRFMFKDARNGSSAGQQAINARVQAQGSKARIETIVSDRPLVVIYTPPFLYRLLPGAKSGVRYQLAPGASVGSLSNNGVVAGLDLQKVLRNPGTLRALLLRAGAKKTGVKTMNNVPLDVYSTRNFGGKPQALTAYLRRDGLPVRLYTSSKRFSLSASWNNYSRSALPASLFSVPANYRVRAAQGTPHIL